MNETLCYALLSASTVMFGLQFFFNDMFRRNYGNSFRAVLVSHLGGGISGLIALVLINGFTFEYSHFALIMAIIVNINSFLLSYCGLKALGKINLSMYSLFMMLGGMVLPFISGILIHGEAITVGKIICFAIISVALIIVVDKDKKGKGFIFYIGIFVLNGMSGVLSKLYHALPYEKISSTGYSILIALISLLLTSIMLLIFGVEKKKLNFKAVIAMAGNGILNRVANWLLLIALLTLPASAQYPFITGGTIIVSTVLSLFTDKKPNKREVIAVALSFIGIIMLLLFNKYEIYTIQWR